MNKQEFEAVMNKAIEVIVSNVYVVRRTGADPGLVDIVGIVSAIICKNCRPKIPAGCTRVERNVRIEVKRRSQRGRSVRCPRHGLVIGIERAVGGPRGTAVGREEKESGDRVENTGDEVARIKRIDR